MMWIFLSCQSAVLEKTPLSWTWSAIDFHVHSSIGSNDTDGTGIPQNIAEAMQRAGLDAVWLTDHSNSLGSMHCSDVEDCPNQGPEYTDEQWPEGVFHGVEISPRASEENLSQPTGHIGCLPYSVNNFGDYTAIDRPFGSVNGSDAYRQCIEAGGYGIVNHPFGPTSWVAYDWTESDVSALETYNGGAGFDASDQAALAHWEDGLANGKTWTAIGASDSHHWETEAPGNLLNTPIGWPHTKVGLKQGQSILEALANGQTVITEPGVELMLTVHTTSGPIGPGQRTDRALEIEVSADTENSGDFDLELRRAPGMTIRRESLNGPITMTLKDPDPGIYYARIWPADDALGPLQRGIAISGAVFID